MAQAWLGCLSWASRDADICARFKEETGKSAFWMQRRTPLDAMIDKATGYEAIVISAFVDWVNTNLWGEDPFSDETRT
jgi:hypothetical protein